MSVTAARLDPKLVADGLEQLGWPRPSTARELADVVTLFQAGWNLGEELKEDGDCGPLTSAALLRSLARQRAGHPTASEHFSFTEFACRCRGAYTGCQRIMVRRQLLTGLEAYRARFSPRAGVSIVSGYRCPGHNKAIGSMADSRHTLGEAADVACIVDWKAVRGLRVFSGIGYQRGTMKVRHLDCRGLDGLALPAASPHASVDDPAVWLYT